MHSLDIISEYTQSLSERRRKGLRLAIKLPPKGIVNEEDTSDDSGSAEKYFPSEA